MGHSGFLMILYLILYKDGTNFYVVRQEAEDCERALAAALPAASRNEDPASSRFKERSKRRSS